MNTDNMTISGETIDYGPCAYIDTYDANAVFSSIDRDGRYAFGNQPVMAQWNLARLAEAMLPLIDADDTDRAIGLATDVIDGFIGRYTDRWTAGMGAKIGLSTAQDGDSALINELLEAMDGQGVDYTQFFRRLASDTDQNIATLFDTNTKIIAWLAAWRVRLLHDPLDAPARRDAMNAVNPIYIPRNHLVEQALQAAEAGDMAPFQKLLEVLSKPFSKVQGLEAFEGPAPASFGAYKTFCGT